MTRSEFAAHLLIMHGQEKETREAGQKEYAHDDDNAFRNFEQTGEDVDISREKALWVFFKKHVDGIKAHINGHTSQRESVHGRIKDARLYLALLDGMITENEQSIRDGLPEERALEGAVDRDLYRTEVLPK